MTKLIAPQAGERCNDPVCGTFGFMIAADRFVNGRRYLLYGWKQCDGDYLNVSDENGNILWQSSIGSKMENAERFISEYLSDRFDF